MVVGDDGCEAYTAIVWGGLLSRESYRSQRSRLLTVPKATRAAPLLLGAVALPWSKTPSRTKGARRNLRDLVSGRAVSAASVRVEKVMSFSRR